MFNNIIFLFIILSLLLSLFIDLLYGELPTSIHPVVIVGKIIDFYKNILMKYRSRLSGFFLYILVAVTSLLILFIVMKIAELNSILFFIVFSVVLSSTFSVRMLISSARDIEDKLKSNIDDARQAVSYLVSRDTEELSESLIVSATIETLTENITDSYLAPVFYYTLTCLIIIIFNKDMFILLLFIPVIYRISNTLDAMVGYKNEKLMYIGYFPAKIDDILNYLPSRIAGLLIVLSAYILKFNYKNSYLMYRRDAKRCPSPNSGYTMATVAGALDIQLTKKNTYILGDSNRPIEIGDISSTIKISKLTMMLFTLIVLLSLTIVYMV